LQNERARQERQRLRDAAIIERYRQGVSQSTPKAIAKSAGVGFVDYALNIPLNFGGYVPFIGPRIQQTAEEFRKIHDRESRQLSDFKPQILLLVKQFKHLKRYPACFKMLQPPFQMFYEFHYSSFAAHQKRLLLFKNMGRMHLLLFTMLS
jgi:hypothetical protein